MEPPSTPGHRPAVAAAMIAAGALIAQQVAGRATRDALFLSTFDVTWLPVVMIVAAVVSAAAVLAFSAALSRRSPARVLPMALAAGTVLLLAEWGLSLVQPRWAAVAVYLHMAAFGATLVSGFWSLVNERFDPYTARRVMGNVTLGASLGGVGGGLLAWGAAGIVPVPAMLAVMAGFNVLCLLALGRLGPPARVPPPAGVADRRNDTGPLAGMRVLKDVRYLRDLALVVALGAVTEAVLDFVLNAHAVQAFPAGQPLMSFFALFHTGVGWMALVVQVALARPALRNLGLAGTVALRPGMVGAAALLGIVHPALWSALVARGTHGVLHNSLFRSGYELLFTPLAERRKRPAKTIVDVGFDRVGTIAGGLLILTIVSALGSQSTRVLFALAAAGAVAALAVSRRLNRGYVTALEESLRSGVIRLDLGDVIDSTTSLTLTRAGLTSAQAVLLRDGASLAAATRGEHGRSHAIDTVAQTVGELRSGQAEVVRRALQRPEAAEPALVGHLIPLLARNDVFLDVLRALRRAAPHATGQLLDALLDPGRDVAIRRRIPRVLRRTATQRAADGLLLGLADPAFRVRQQCALTLAHITARAATLAVPRAPVFAAVLRELEGAPQGWTQAAEPLPAEGDTKAERPATPAERGLAHVFTLLSLAVEREPLQIAYWALLGADPGLRGTALEYLANVLPDDVRRALWPHVGARSEAASATARTRQRLEQDLMRSSDSLGASRPMKTKRNLPG